MKSRTLRLPRPHLSGALCAAAAAGCLWLAVAGTADTPQDLPAAVLTAPFSASASPEASPEAPTEDDGVLPPWHEPEPLATPDPDRETAPVAETFLSGGEEVDGFHVKDTSGSGVDLLEELTVDPDVHVRRDGTPVVLFYSTHTCESFLRQDAGWYYTDESFRDLDPEKSIVSVAAEAAAVIEAGGFGVIHDRTVHDSPAFSGSYQRSWETIQKNLELYPTIQITVDLHRDAFGEEDDGTRYKPVAEIDGRQAAQIMILAGCDLEEDPLFPDWRENLHLALRLQQKGEALFPGLCRPLNFTQRNYNLHATHGSLLIEIGTEVNTLDEAKYSGRLLGETILAVLEDLAE